jgi:hypothetical protein
MVGEYISIEQKNGRTKDSYCDVLGKVSYGWYEGKNDYVPFIRSS